MLDYVLLDDPLEFTGDVIALQGHGLDAIHVHRRDGRLPRSGQADPDVRVLALARPIHDASHHCHVHSFDAAVALAPHRHLRPEIALDAIGEFLKEGARRAPAAGARDHQRRERTQAHRLQHLLRHDDLAAAVAARLRRQRNPYGVADAFLQQHRHRGRRSDDALGSHAGLGETQMQGVIAARRKFTVDRDQILHPAHLARQHDPLARESQAFSLARAVECRGDQRFARDHRCRGRFREPRILIHHARQQLRIEAAPVDADAHRLPVAARELDHRRELVLALRAATDVARIDAQLRQRLRARRVLGEQPVAVEVKIPYQRHIDAHPVQPLPEARHLCRRFRIVDRHAHDLRTRARKLRRLFDRRGEIRGVGVGHRLHDDRGAAADHDRSDPDGAARAPRRRAMCGETVHSSVSRATSYLVWGARSTARSL